MSTKSRALFMTMMLALMCSPLHAFASSPVLPHPTPTCNADRENWTVGVIFCDNQATAGYTLFSPIPSNTTYLIDQEGRWVHEWSSPGEHRPALSAYLLPDGDLLRTANIASSAVGNFSGGGTGGKLERISWEGELEWSWEYSSETFISHHDIEPMPNGNILMIAWEERTEEEALQAGRNPEIASDSPGGQNNIWPDHIVEIEPVGNDSANIVWRWHAWDHLIQDYDPTKDNYGVVEDHPELININYAGGTGNAAGRADWMHCNGIDYNPILDQIAISCRSMHEIYIIDHSTTTEEAAGHSGGNSGKGGDLLYRWGNPQVYHKGLSSDQQLFGQHDVNWIPEGHPFAGGLALFNNGNGRYPAYSSVEILQPSMSNGTYELASNGTYGPVAPTWTWNMGETMYSGSISGVDALPNGHMLVTHGTHGTLFEIDQNGAVVWHYVNPIGGDGTVHEQFVPVPPGPRAGTTANQIFKAHHVSADHPALENRTLVATDYLEAWQDACPTQSAWGWDRNGDGCIDDSDDDGTVDPMDLCPVGDDRVDEDNDDIPDACDDFVDSDGDGIPNGQDACPGFDDTVDEDEDGVPDACDVLVDRDEDGVADADDRCNGSDDTVDVDGDLIPDGCDELIDSDNDGVANQLDRCEGHDDRIDIDNDEVPDGCDASLNSPTGANVSDDEANLTTNDTALDDASSFSGSLGSTLIVVTVTLLVSVVLTTGYVRLRQPPLFSAEDDTRLEEVAVGENKQPTNDDDHEFQEPPSMS